MKRPTPETIFASGGIGDLFIVACKLYSNWKKKGTQFILQRYDPTKGYDAPLTALFKQFPFISYRTPTKDLNELSADLHTGKGIYLGVAADGSAFGAVKTADPKGYTMEPYPQLIAKKKKHTGINIGIQLQTGKERGNFKGLPLRWIERLIKKSPQGIIWHLLGTPTNYDPQQVEAMCKKHGIVNHVGKTTFDEWLKQIADLDYYITPEGFSAFFALSQGISCHVFYRIEEDLRRIHPAWKKHAQFEYVPNRVLLLPLLKGKLWQRIKPSNQALAGIRKLH